MPRYDSLSEVPPAILEKAGRFISNFDKDDFIVKGLPPEVEGALLVRESRVKTDIRLTLINEFLGDDGEPCLEKGTQIVDRVVNSFGDDSCQEFANVKIGIARVSQLLTKYIEDRRIGGSPIEKSTRYVAYDEKGLDGRWAYLRPVEIVGSGSLGRFEQVNDRAFEVYSEGIARLKPHFSKELPKEKFTIKVKRGEHELDLHEKDCQTKDEADAFRIAYNFTIRCAALDVARCVLPASTLTQFAVDGNARYFTNLLSFLKSQPLQESVSRASGIEAELDKEIPTFIKRNKANPSWAQRDEVMRGLAASLFSGITPERNQVSLAPRLFYFDEVAGQTKMNYLDEVVGQAIFPYTDISLIQIYDRLKSVPSDVKVAIFNDYIGLRKDRRDRSGRGLEAGYPLTFDIVSTFGEYRDLERHRMLTQQRQRIGTSLGFSMPEEIAIVGLEQEVKEVVSMMDSLNSDLRRQGLEDASQYATLFNNYVRFMFGMNLREFQHLSELRTGPKGHFGYRSIVMDMSRQVQSAYDFTKAALGFVDYSDPGNKIARANEQSRIAGKNLVKGIDGGQDY